MGFGAPVAQQQTASQLSIGCRCILDHGGSGLQWPAGRPLPYAGLSPLAGRGLSPFFRLLASVSSTQGEPEAASFGKSHDFAVVIGNCTAVFWEFPLSQFQGKESDWPDSQVNDGPCVVASEAGGRADVTKHGTNGAGLGQAGYGLTSTASLCV